MNEDQPSVPDGSRPGFTPGPWHCSPEADLHRIGVYAGDTIICDVTDEDLERDGEFEANARLIRAAPAMYGILCGLVAELDSYEVSDLLLAEPLRLARQLLAEIGGGE